MTIIALLLLALSSAIAGKGRGVSEGSIRGSESGHSLASNISQFVKPGSPPKYFAIDIDGTFYTGNKEAMERNVKAFAEVKKKGYIPFFCTENTLTSIGKALEYGAHGVEFDVFLTGLGDIIVCHGREPNGRINYNYLQLVNGSPELIPDDVTCENLTLSPDQLVAKMPWIHGRDVDEVKNVYPTLSQDAKNEAIDEYARDNHVWKKEEYEKLPRLEDIFKKYGNKLKYNVELKGTKPELGLRVLEILQRYPDLDVIVSSFTWIPPELKQGAPHYDSELEHFPNGRMEVDILRPLVDKLPKNVSLGLLFNYKENALCSIPRIVEIAKSYKAKFVNVVYDFWKEGHGILGANPETGKKTLKNLVDELHKHNISLLTYWCQRPDNPEDYKTHIEAGVDIICPNDVKAATKLIAQMNGEL